MTMSEYCRVFWRCHKLYCLSRIVIIEKEKALLAEDNEKERALQAILKTRFDEMTKKFDMYAPFASIFIYDEL